MLSEIINGTIAALPAFTPAIIPEPHHLIPAILNHTAKAAKATTALYPPLFTARYLPITTIVNLILTWICSSAGIGGAALDSVVFIWTMGLQPKQVSPLTKALVLGESLGGYLINFRRHHPFIKRPLINYEVALAFEPFSLLGTFWGIYANQAFPSYIILAGLILALGFAAVRTLYKGFQIWKKEREDATDSTSNRTGDGEEMSSPQSGKVIVPTKSTENDDSGFDENPCDWFLGTNEGIKYFPWKIYLFLFGNWIVLAIFNVVVAGNTVSSITCGSGIYWGLMVLTFPLLAALAFGTAVFLRRLFLKRREQGVVREVTDITWTTKKIFVFQACSLATGVLSAMFGLGGGTLNSPMLLELGLIPAQIPATSGLLILLTSSVAVIQYFALGRAQWQYQLWFIMVGFLGGVSGHLGIRYFVKKYRKQSFIVFLLGSLVLLGMIVLIYTVAISFVNKTAIMTLQSPCG